MKKTRIQILILVAMVTCGLAVAHTMANRKPQKAPVSSNPPKPLYDTVLLRKFVQLSKMIDNTQKEYVVNGTIDYTNPVDTSESFHAAPFTYSKKNDDYYYRLGTTETFFFNGLNVFVDHEVKRITVSLQPGDAATRRPFAPERIKEMLENKEYELKSSISGTKQCISIINDDHLICKEYSITYDTVLFKPERIMSRLTVPRLDESHNAEKVIDMAIKDIEPNSNIEKYSVQEIVEREADHYKPAARFKEYKLTEL